MRPSPSTPHRASRCPCVLLPSSEAAHMMPDAGGSARRHEDGRRGVTCRVGVTKSSRRAARPSGRGWQVVPRRGPRAFVLDGAVPARRADGQPSRGLAAAGCRPSGAAASRGRSGDLMEVAIRRVAPDGWVRTSRSPGPRGSSSPARRHDLVAGGAPSVTRSSPASSGRTSGAEPAGVGARRGRPAVAPGARRTVDVRRLSTEPILLTQSDCTPVHRVARHLS